MDLEYLKGMARARAGKVEAITHAAGSDYPKFGAWLSLHCRDAEEAKRHLEQARAEGMPDFTPGADSPTPAPNAEAPTTPTGSSSADEAEAAAIAARILSYS